MPGWLHLFQPLEEPVVKPGQIVSCGCTFAELTNSSSMLVWHFSRFILFMATRSCLGIQRAACTTAVAPLPGITTTTQQWQSRQERGQRTQLEECTQSIAAPHPNIRPLVLFTHVFMRGIHHHLARVLLQTRLIVYLVPYKSDHAGVAKSFPPRSRDTSQMAGQLLAADKERQKPSREQRSQPLTAVVLLISYDTTSQLICTAHVWHGDISSPIFKV